MNRKAKQDFLDKRRHSGRSVLLGGMIAAAIIAVFLALGGDLGDGLGAPDVRIDSALAFPGAASL
jgi:hypothetical protein